MDSAKLGQFVNDKWDSEIVPQLVDYIRIPNKSPMFDANWVQNGYMEQAVTLMENWARAQQLPGLKVEVVRLEGRTPLIFLEIPRPAPKPATTPSCSTAIWTSSRK